MSLGRNILQGGHQWAEKNIPIKGVVGGGIG